jgi:hypothetical protein
MGLLDDLFEIVFPRRQYGTRSTTRLGVEVRSRAEQRIADYFDSIGLRYEYERDLESGFWIFTEKVSSPDFYLPDFDVYVEYWGMLGVDNNYDREKYTREMKYKMARYHDLGVKFISIYPDNLKNLDWIFRKRFQAVTGQYLPSGSRPREDSGLKPPPSSLDAGQEGAGSACCPSCGQPMVLRTSRRGANAGTQFWGCPSYPACKGTRKFTKPAN